MKKLILILVLLIPFTLSAQHNNVSIFPTVDTVCYNTEISIQVQGNSFQPYAYSWSGGGYVGHSTSTITITESGLYSIFVTGFLGNGRQIRTLHFYKHYTVLDKPKLNFTN